MRNPAQSQSVIIAIATALACIPVFGAPTDGTLSGLVVDQNGDPIPNALVVYRSVTRPIRQPNGRQIASGPVFGSGGRTGPDGRFAVSGLPPAAYDLCAFGVKPTDLGTCEWGPGAIRVDVAAGQTADVKFQIAEGALVTVVVQDVKRQIVDLSEARTGDGRMPLSGGNFAIGVWHGTRYVRAKLVSTTAASRSYQLAVPKAAVRLHIDSPFKVLDASGAAITSGRPSSAISAVGQSVIAVNLTVP